MTREEVYQSCLDALKDHQVLILEAATGLGKTRMSIDLINHYLENQIGKKRILILVAKTVHKQNWLAEIDKWGGFKGDIQIVMECYESLKKHEGETFDFIIMDECHHLQSELRQDLFLSLKINHKAIGLSATIPRDLKRWFCAFFHTKIVKASIEEAIQSNILPTPKIMLIPLTLDDNQLTETIEINPKTKGKTYYGYYKDLWTYKSKKLHAIIKCTQKQKSDWLNKEVTYKKNTWERTHLEALKFSWLKACADRLKFLALAKNNIVLEILAHLQDKRTLTFCNNIEQTETLGKYCIHSKNNSAEDILNLFNTHRIDHITACQIMNEGVNLTDCQYGIFANINASDIIIKQRQGRILRHEHPVMVIPYYKGTREEELVRKMFKDYDKSLIHICHDIKEL